VLPLNCGEKMSRDWKKSVIKQSDSILDAVKAIDASGLQAATIIDDQSRLVGLVTDGDVRRGILRGVNLQNPVAEIMTTTPTVAKADMTKEQILSIMRMKVLHMLPIVNAQGHLTGMELMDDLIKGGKYENTVFLLAG